MLRITTAVTALLALAAAAGPGTPSNDAPVTAELEHVKELRLLPVKPQEQQQGGFVMFDTPGLELRFGLQVAEERTLVEIREPGSVTATDSTGHDLAALPPSRLGVSRHVETISAWEAAPHAFTFRLGLPKRNAKTFSLEAVLEAVTCGGTKTRSIAPTRDWTPVPAGLFGATEVQMRLSTRNASVNVEFRPGTVRPMIESVTVEIPSDGGNTTLETEGAMWNASQIGYGFTGPLPAGVAPLIQVTVRQDVRTTPLALTVASQKLP